MAKLWAEQIVLDNRKFSQVPRLLKEKVKEILIEEGKEELIDE